jgi:hypothetical protein
MEKAKVIFFGMLAAMGLFFWIDSLKNMEK